MSNEKLVLQSKVNTLENQIEMLQTIDKTNLVNDDNRYAVVSFFFF